MGLISVRSEFSSGTGSAVGRVKQPSEKPAVKSVDNMINYFERMAKLTVKVGIPL